MRTTRVSELERVYNYLMDSPKSTNKEDFKDCTTFEESLKVGREIRSVLFNM